MDARTLALSLLLAGTAAAEPPPPPVWADAVFVGGKVWTGDPARPEVEAVAVWRGRILQVGTTAHITQLANDKTRVVELNGRRVVPGFHDSHVHMLGGGFQLSRVDLKDARDEAGFGERLRKFDRESPKGWWILGGNWDHDRTFKGELPTAATVDKYVPDRPVWIERYDGHMALANTAAMRAAGITPDQKEVAGGVVFRLADGKTPSGVFKDNAMSLIQRHVPKPSQEEIAKAVRDALAEARRLGVTSVQDMDGSDPATRRTLFRLYQSMAKQGELTARIDLRWPIDAAEGLVALGAESGLGDDFLRVGGVKGFIDGSLGSSTAKFDAPYESDPKTTGVYVTSRARIRELVALADAANLNVAIHAIGDRGNADVLDIFEAVGKGRDRRFRVEHAQHLRPDDIPRFGRLKVIASMQPYHIIDDGRWAEGRIGTERCRTSYCNRSLLDAGATLAFGSDWPVAPLDPIAGVDAAVNRRTLDGKHPGGWFPEQKITAAEALTAYTFGSAFAASQERDRGTITPGKLADLVVLSDDVLAPKNREAIMSIKVDMTVVGGRVVFERK